MIDVSYEIDRYLKEFEFDGEKQVIDELMDGRSCKRSIDLCLENGERIDVMISCDKDYTLHWEPCFLKKSDLTDEEIDLVDDAVSESFEWLYEEVENEIFR